jgi:hypothetical protein
LLSLVIETVAPGITPPESFTAPRRPPVNVCAQTLLVASGSIKSASRHHNFKGFLILAFLQIHETSDSKSSKASRIAGVYGSVSDNCKDEPFL